LATKRARVKVLVLVYELNVKLTYFKTPARTTDNSQLQKEHQHTKGSTQKKRIPKIPKVSNT